MRIGILSDIHGHQRRLLSALEVLSERQVSAVVVCGDLGSGEVLRTLGQSGLRAYAVAGNVDHHEANLEQAAAEAGVTFDWNSVEIDIGGGRRLAATHGHLHLLEELIASQAFPYVCHGHTHRLADSRRGLVRVINPGALHHPRQPHYPTFVILDTDSDQLEVVRAE
jgi:uncharacterized protein